MSLSSLIILSFLAMIVTCNASSFDILAGLTSRGEGDSASRLQVANLDVDWQEEFTMVCNWTVPDKIDARFRSLAIKPQGYNWLSADPSVSIYIQSCTGTLPSTGQSVVLFNNGAPTIFGTAIHFELTRDTPQDTTSPITMHPTFSGRYLPFTLGPKEIDAESSDRIGVRIECIVAYCNVPVNSDLPPNSGDCPY